MIDKHIYVVGMTDDDKTRLRIFNPGASGEIIEIRNIVLDVDPMLGLVANIAILR